MTTFFSVLGVALVLTALLLLVSKDARRLTVVGLGVGVVLGFWFVAPLALRLHYLYPETISQWCIVAGFFFVVFAGWSALLSALASWLPVGFRFVTGSRSLPIPLTFALAWATVAIPLGYVLVGVGIELSVFSRLVSIAELLTFSYVAAALAVLALTTYHWARRRQITISGGGLATVLFGAGAVGMLVLPPMHSRETASDQAASAPALVRKSEAPSGRPLLVIGLDGGSWQVLRPSIKRGHAPRLAQLAGGIEGSVEALWPPYWSTPAWGAILTGYDTNLGVHEDLSAEVKGLPLFELPLTLSLALNPVYLVELALIRANVVEPAPVPRQALRRPLIWERLSAAGITTAVIRFPFTYPAGEQASAVVSNRVVTDLWDLMGVELGRREDLVNSPAGTDLMAWFDDRFKVDDAALRQILPTPAWPKPADSVVDPSAVARTVFGIGQRMFSLTEHLIRQKHDLQVVMLHVTDLDNISHAFWAYRFPEEFPKAPPSRADAAALGPVVDRYVAYLDNQLGRLIDAFPQVPNVVVVSDHGQAAATDSTMSLWRGWHSAAGVFMAAGPDIETRADHLPVSYVDIVPTILDLLNFERPQDLVGESLLAQKRSSQPPEH